MNTAATHVPAIAGPPSPTELGGLPSFLSAGAAATVAELQAKAAEHAAAIQRLKEKKTRGFKDGEIDDNDIAFTHNF